MAEILLGHADYSRGVAKEARIRTRNRYFEANPSLTTDSKTALISRPALVRALACGDGPIRAVYSQSGSFDDALFVASGGSLFRIDVDLTVTALFDGLNGTVGPVVMAATSNIGTTPEYLFIADGRNLWLYVANGYAIGEASGSPHVNDVFVLGEMSYKFTSGSVDAGTPDGTNANPWLVKLGAGDAASWQALFDAINATGTPGTDYSTALQINGDATAYSVEATALSVRATVVGGAGNGIPTTTTSTSASWTHATLTGGGSASVTQVATPDDVGVISVGYCASYVVVIPAQGEGINGRFWWINPGETTIDALDYATAEQAPDPIFSVIVFGDQFWLPGSSTTEVWYFTGNQDSPVARLQGITFDRGTWAGTAVQVKESMIIVDNDGGVFQIAGGLTRISTPDIEERIRKAIQVQAAKLAL